MSGSLSFRLETLRTGSERRFFEREASRNPLHRLAPWRDGRSETAQSGRLALLRNGATICPAPDARPATFAHRRSSASGQSVALSIRSAADAEAFASALVPRSKAWVPTGGVQSRASNGFPNLSSRRCLRERPLREFREPSVGASL
jgi:hypothetical protein